MVMAQRPNRVATLCANYRNHGYLRSANGATTSKIDQPGSVYIYSRGINAGGEIAGHFGVFFS
jgi:hypothetical protein